MSAVVGGEGFHHTALELIDDGVAVRGEVVLQVSGLDDLHCIREADLRLILDGGSGVDLRAGLAIGEEHVQADAGGECCLAVLACDLDVGVTEAPSPVRVLPAKDVPDDELLPRLKTEALPGPLTLGVLEALDEGDDADRRLAIEVPALVEGVVQIAVVSLYGQLYQLAGEDLLVSYLLSVQFCRM